MGTKVIGQFCPELNVTTLRSGIWNHVRRPNIVRDPVEGTNSGQVRTKVFVEAAPLRRRCSPNTHGCSAPRVQDKDATRARGECAQHFLSRHDDNAPKRPPAKDVMLGGVCEHPRCKRESCLPQGLKATYHQGSRRVKLKEVPIPEQLNARPRRLSPAKVHLTRHSEDGQARFPFVVILQRLCQTQGLYVMTRCPGREGPIVKWSQRCVQLRSWRGAIWDGKLSNAVLHQWRHQARTG
jgi:hypothetical protein